MTNHKNKATKYVNYRTEPWLLPALGSRARRVLAKHILPSLKGTCLCSFGAFLCVITTSSTLPKLYGIVSANNADYAEIRRREQQDEHRSPL